MFFFSHEDTFKLFVSVVEPVLCYGSEIWGYCENNRQNSKKILKAFLLFEFKYSCECGRLPLLFLKWLDV